MSLRNRYSNIVNSCQCVLDHPAIWANPSDDWSYETQAYEISYAVNLGLLGRRVYFSYPLFIYNGILRKAWIKQGVIIYT